MRERYIEQEMLPYEHERGELDTGQRTCPGRERQREKDRERDRERERERDREIER